MGFFFCLSLVTHFPYFFLPFAFCPISCLHSLSLVSFFVVCFISRAQWCTKVLRVYSVALLLFVCWFCVHLLFFHLLCFYFTVVSVEYCLCYNCFSQTKTTSPQSIPTDVGQRETTSCIVLTSLMAILRVFGGTTVQITHCATLGI